MSILSRRLRRLALAAGVSGAGLIGAGLVAPGLRDVAVPVGGAELRIGSATLHGGLLGIALAQAADVTLENVTIEAGPATYRIPRITFVGVSLAQAELRDLLSGKTGAATAERLARLSAREVRAPEVIVEQVAGEERQVTTLRDIVGGPIVNGRIAAITAAGAGIVVAGAHPGTGSYGRLAAEGVDLAHAARVYSESAGAGPNEMKPLYGAASIEGIRFAQGDGAEVTIGRIAARDVRARLARLSWADMVRTITELSGSDSVPPARMGALVDAVADLLDSVAIGSAEFADMAVRDPKDGGANARVGRIAFQGSGAGPAETRLEGLDFGSPDGTLRIASMSSRGFSFAPVLAGLRSFAADPDQEMTPGLMRRFVPELGTTRISGISIDSPAGPGGGVTVRDIEVATASPRNGIPTDLRIAVENAAFTLPQDTEDETVKSLAAMGYKAMNLTMRLSATWAEGASQMQLREVVVQGQDMGRVALTGTLGNVTKDVFDADEAVAMVSLLGVTAKSVEVTVENQGLFERFIAQEARAQSASPEAIRREYGTVASVGIPALLGNSPDAKSLAQAIARFIAKPGTLSIKAKAKDEAGLGVADIIAIDTPAEALRQVQVSASAN